MAAVCNSLFVLPWETMPKPVLIWAFSLVIGERLLIAVSFDQYITFLWTLLMIMIRNGPLSCWYMKWNCHICSVTAVKCKKNQEFSYNIHVCNHTCRSLSVSDPRCGLDDAPVEGCGCPEGTHLNLESTCTPKAECFCHYNGGTTPPGPVVIDGRQWWVNLILAAE